VAAFNYLAPVRMLRPRDRLSASPAQLRERSRLARVRVDLSRERRPDATRPVGEGSGVQAAHQLVHLLAIVPLPSAGSSHRDCWSASVGSELTIESAPD
jgi:hypothetical protein